MLSPNTILQSRYQIIRLLGQGGMGAVYLAQDARLGGHQVAVKENGIASAAPMEFVEASTTQFQTEAVILARLNHPNLPRVMDHFMEGGNQYLVMDYIAGEDMNDMVRRVGALPESQVLPWLRQVMDAVTYLHANKVIHRDIKASNIRITPEGKAVLVDFGLAKVQVDGQLTVTAAHGGSPGFAPPEQYSGGTDERTDVYALGATLYYVLSGQLPIESTMRAIGEAMSAPRQLNATITPHTGQVIVRAMSIQASARFQSAAEMSSALFAPPAETVTPPQPIPAPRRRTWPVLAVSALAALALIGVIVWQADNLFPRATPTTVAALPTAALVAAPVAASTSAPIALTTQAATANQVTTPTAATTPTITPSSTHTPTAISTVNPSAKLRAKLDDAWDRNDWQQVIMLIEAVRVLDPTDLSLSDKLYAARINYAEQLIGASDFGGAEDQCRAARTLNPSRSEALNCLQRLTPMPPPRLTATFTPIPPTATVTPIPTPANTPTPYPTVVTVRIPSWSSNKVKLLWDWSLGLQADEWFDVRMWRDVPGASHDSIGWTKDTQFDVGMCGRPRAQYRWTVVLVRGAIQNGQNILQQELTKEGSFEIVAWETRC